MLFKTTICVYERSSSSDQLLSDLLKENTFHFKQDLLTKRSDDIKIQTLFLLLDLKATFSSTNTDCQSSCIRSIDLHKHLW